MKQQLIIFLLLCSFGLQAQVIGDFTEAEITTETTFLDALLNKNKGKTKEAVLLFKECLATDNRNHASAFEIAKIYLSEGNNEDAIKYGAKALKQSPKNRWYRVFMSNIYLETLNFSKASDLLKNMILDYPGERYFYEQLAFAERQSGDELKAIASLNALEKVIGVDEDNIKKKFDLYMSQKDISAAEMELQKLSNTDPNDARYLANLAQFKYEHGNKEAAILMYKKVLLLDPNNERANFLLASVPDDTKQADSADRHPLSKIISNASIDVNPKIKELIPYVEDAQNLDSLQLAQLNELLGDLREVHPRSPKATAISGDFYNQIGDTKTAISWYEKTLGLNDNIYTVWEQLMLAQVQSKDYKALLKRSEQAIDLFPNQVSAYIYHAKALKEAGRKKEAMEILSEARLIAGNNKLLLKQIDSLENEQ